MIFPRFHDRAKKFNWRPVAPTDEFSCHARPESPFMKARGDGDTDGQADWRRQPA
ncbi:MAG: hypothetical protein U0840_01135 [Gemmataceae bacterium]